jgi:hypothetical protein
MTTRQTARGFATVLSTIPFCTAGCGVRTRAGMCSECARLDPEAMRQHRQQEKLRAVRALARNGADPAGTCLSCGHWQDRCLMEIPECSPTWARKCSCYLPEAA